MYRLRKCWDKLVTGLEFDTSWISTQMNMDGLLSDSDHEEVIKVKSLLSETQKAEILVRSLLKKVKMDSKNLGTFVSLLKAKPRMYDTVIEILESK